MVGIVVEGVRLDVGIEALRRVAGADDRSAELGDAGAGRFWGAVKAWPSWAEVLPSPTRRSSDRNSIDSREGRQGRRVRSRARRSRRSPRGPRIAGQPDQLAAQKNLVAELIRVSRRFGCLISPARSSRVSRSPYSFQKLGRGLGTDAGRAGDVVDAVADQGLESTILSGVTPNFSITASSSRRLSFIGSYMMTPPPISCIRSLSDETMTAWPPAARALQA